MALTHTPRFTLPQWSEGSDTYPGRVGWNDILGLLEEQAAVAIPSGLLSNRPAGGTFGRFYYATDASTNSNDAGRLYYDSGTGWVELNTNGGGGAGRAIAVRSASTAGDEGVSVRSARADHVHHLPLATRTTHGALSAAFAVLLQDATSVSTSATVDTLMRRNWRGAVQVAAPQDPLDATNKSYVDNTAGTFSATPNTLVRRYTNGCFRSAAPEGPEDVANRRYVDDVAGTWRRDANTLARRGADGTFLVAPPTTTLNPATKQYVDTVASRQAWKHNVRPAPYGLAEVMSIDTALFDYREDEDVPVEVRGTRNVLGAFVEDVAADLPLLAVDGEDGQPERINTRELIWPVIRAVQELGEENDALREQVHELREELAAVRHHLGL